MIFPPSMDLETASPSTKGYPIENNFAKKLTKT
jgi:hypothetical protein